MNKYIYSYFDPERNEFIYFGQGTKRRGCYERAFGHLSRKDKHPFTQRLQLMANRGVHPIITIMIEGIDKELADLIEIEAIDRYGRKDLGKGPLLNLTDGGGGANCVAAQTEEVKLRRAASISLAWVDRDDWRASVSSAARREDVSKKKSIAMKEKMKDPEEKRKRSLKLKGRKLTKEHCDAIKASWDKRRGVK